MLIHSFKHMNMLTCICSHNHFYTNMNMFISTQNEPALKLTCLFINTFMNMINNHTQTLSHTHILMHSLTERGAHINKFTQMNIVTHSLTDEYGYIMHTLTNSLIHMNIQTHLNTLSHIFMLTYIHTVTHSLT